MPEERTAPSKTEWQRGTWPRLSRWLGVGVALSLIAGLVMTGYRVHVVLNKPFVLKEVLVYFAVAAMFMILLPQFVLEADYFKLEKDGFCVRTLFLSFREKWSDVRGFYNPVWLKFAILKGRKFVYFLNKRDLPEFEQLAKTITENAPQLPR